MSLRRQPRQARGGGQRAGPGAGSQCSGSRCCAKSSPQCLQCAVLLLLRPATPCGPGGCAGEGWARWTDPPEPPAPRWRRVPQAGARAVSASCPHRGLRVRNLAEDQERWLLHPWGCQLGKQLAVSSTTLQDPFHKPTADTLAASTLSPQAGPWAPSTALGSHWLCPPFLPGPAAGRPQAQCPPCHPPSPAAAGPHVSSGSHPRPGSAPGSGAPSPAGQRAATGLRPPPVPSLFPRSPAAALPLAGSELPVPWPQPPEPGAARGSSCASLRSSTQALGASATSPEGFGRAGSRVLPFAHAPEQPCSSAPCAGCSLRRGRGSLCQRQLSDVLGLRLLASPKDAGRPQQEWFRWTRDHGAWWDKGEPSWPGTAVRGPAAAQQHWRH